MCKKKYFYSSGRTMDVHSFRWLSIFYCLSSLLLLLLLTWIKIRKTGLFFVDLHSNFVIASQQNAPTDSRVRLIRNMLACRNWQWEKWTWDWRVNHPVNSYWKHLHLDKPGFGCGLWSYRYLSRWSAKDTVHPTITSSAGVDMNPQSLFCGSANMPMKVISWKPLFFAATIQTRRLQKPRKEKL